MNDSQAIYCLEFMRKREPFRKVRYDLDPIGVPRLGRLIDPGKDHTVPL